jgi:hypothetical protein
MMNFLNCFLRFVSFETCAASDMALARLGNALKVATNFSLPPAGGWQAAPFLPVVGYAG